MKKEFYSVKCPRHILFGDPLYFKEFKGKERLRLVADCRPPQYFSARIILKEEPFEKFPDRMARSMNLFLAPERFMDTYVNGYKFKSQTLEEKEIGVDTARYLIAVDGRQLDIEMGSDGYWGEYCELFRMAEKRKILDAIGIFINLPESETFEHAKEIIHGLFEDVQQLEMSSPMEGQIKMN